MNGSEQDYIERLHEGVADKDEEIAKLEVDQLQDELTRLRGALVAIQSWDVYR